MAAAGAFVHVGGAEGLAASIWRRYCHTLLHGLRSCESAWWWKMNTPAHTIRLQGNTSAISAIIECCDRRVRDRRLPRNCLALDGQRRPQIFMRRRSKMRDPGLPPATACPSCPIPSLLINALTRHSPYEAHSWEDRWRDLHQLCHLEGQLRFRRRTTRLQREQACSTWSGERDGWRSRKRKVLAKL